MARLTLLRKVPVTCTGGQTEHIPVLKDIPLYVVTEEKIGLLGTREQAIRIAEEMRAELTIAT